MTKNQLLALAAFITSLANSEAEATPTPPAEDKPQPDTEREPKPRGRPKAKAEAPEPEPAKEPEPPKVVGKTVEELRAAIADLVKAGRGEEVKALIKAHGGENLSSLPPANHDAFLKDVEGLSL